MLKKANNKLKGNKIMLHTQEEIINALKVIQDTCNAQVELNPCVNCPLSKNGDCVLQEQPPADWEIKSNNSVWKAFE